MVWGLLRHFHPRNRHKRCSQAKRKIRPGWRWRRSPQKDQTAIPDQHRRPARPSGEIRIQIGRRKWREPGSETSISVFHWRLCQCPGSRQTANTDITWRSADPGCTRHQPKLAGRLRSNTCGLIHQPQRCWRDCKCSCGQKTCQFRRRQRAKRSDQVQAQRRPRRSNNSGQEISQNWRWRIKHACQKTGQDRHGGPGRRANGQPQFKNCNRRRNQNRCQTDGKIIYRQRLGSIGAPHRPHQPWYRRIAAHAPAA